MQKVIRLFGLIAFVLAVGRRVAQAFNFLQQAMQWVPHPSSSWRSAGISNSRSRFQDSCGHLVFFSLQLSGDQAGSILPL